MSNVRSLADHIEHDRHYSWYIARSNSKPPFFPLCRKVLHTTCRVLKSWWRITVFLIGLGPAFFTSLHPRFLYRTSDHEVFNSSPVSTGLHFMTKNCLAHRLIKILSRQFVCCHNVWYNLNKADLNPVKFWQRQAVALFIVRGLSLSC